ncbi:hypothetical protein RhiTH_005947 [Rhizoctonia solani]
MASDYDYISRRRVRQKTGLFDVAAVGLKPFSEVSDFMHGSGHGEIIDRHLRENQVTQEMGGLGQALALLRCRVPGVPYLVQVKPLLITPEAIDAHASTSLSFQGNYDWVQLFQRAIREEWARLYHMSSIAASCFVDAKHKK